MQHILRSGIKHDDVLDAVGKVERRPQLIDLANHVIKTHKMGIPTSSLTRPLASAILRNQIPS